MIRTLFALTSTLMLLAITPFHGSTQDGVGRESAYHRALRAAELRDSIVRYRVVKPNTNLNLPAGVTAFLDSPYEVDPPSLRQLEDAMVTVNSSLWAQTRGKDGDDQNVLSSAGTGAISLLAGGSAALPMIAQGATEFFVQRAQDEVAFSFIVRLHDDLSSDKLISAAFPGSLAMMSRVESETFQSITPQLRSAFIQDLDLLPSRSDALISALHVRTGVTQENLRGYLQAIAVVYERGREIRDGVAPSVALSNLVALKSTQIQNGETRRALRTIGLLAREYSAAGGDPMIQAFAQRDRGSLRRYFVALLARDLIGIEGDDADGQTAAILGLFRERESDVIAILNQLNALRGDAAAVRADADQAAERIRNNPEQVLSGVGAVLGIMRTAPRLAYLPAVQIPAHVQQFDSIVGEGLRLHKAIVQKDYTTVVNWIAQNPRFTPCANTTTRPCRAQQQFFALASAVATAESADEVETAFRAASSPVGSYRVKRNQMGGWFAPRSVSVIGYLGAGRYQTAAVDTLDEDVDGGVTLPVGPELTFGMWWGAMSLFVPVLDLGPLANQAMGLADSDASAELDTQELVAPGVGIVLNLTRGFPLSIGAAVTSSYRDNGDQPGYRVARSILFVGIDATLFNFRF